MSNRPLSIAGLHWENEPPARVPLTKPPTNTERALKDAKGRNLVGFRLLSAQFWQGGSAANPVT
jgi:hypothetical protein